MDLAVSSQVPFEIELEWCDITYSILLKQVHGIPGRAQKVSATFFNGKCCMTKKYTQLTMDERTFIQLGLTAELKPITISMIAFS